MNELEEFDTDCIPYIDENGFFLRNPGDEEPDGNPNVYGAVRCCIRVLKGWKTTTSAKIAFMQRIGKVTPSPGLLDRSPEKRGDRNAYDDYLAAAAESKFTDNGIVAATFYQRGKKHFWYYQNEPGNFFEKFTFSNWFARIPGFIPHIKALLL